MGAVFTDLAFSEISGGVQVLPPYYYQVFALIYPEMFRFEMGNLPETYPNKIRKTNSGLLLIPMST